MVFHAVFKEVDRPEFEVKVTPTIQDPIMQDGNSVVARGNKIKYKVEVKNTGNVPLKNLSLTDVLCGYTDNDPDHPRLTGPDTLDVGDT